MKVWVNRYFLLTLVTGLALVSETAVQATEAELVAATQKGRATYYGHGWHGKRTASGVRFNKNALVAAHPSLPFGTVVKVTNLSNGRVVPVRIVDRGPSRRVQRRKGVIIDVSQESARQLGFVNRGITPVELAVLRAN